MSNILQAAGQAGEPARSLEGRVAIVTGSTSGIGLGIAQALAARGALIVLNGLGDRDEIAGICQAMEAQYDVSVTYDDADLAGPASVHDMIERTAHAMGAVDILVNNAGIQHVEPIETFPAAKWDAILALNLSAVFHATQAVLGTMKKRGWGRIVNISSAHGLVASPFKGAYVAAKHGVIGFTKVTALEAAESGVTCNAVCPGYVLTPLVQRQIAEQAAVHGIPEDQVIRTIMLAEQPTRRFVTVAEVAATVAFLCSAGAASITGAAITVDGGWTAR
jgi:3-hydroxybutyrate dehydrogenase